MFRLPPLPVLGAEDVAMGVDRLQVGDLLVELDPDNPYGDMC